MASTVDAISAISNDKALSLFKLVAQSENYDTNTLIALSKLHHKQFYSIIKKLITLSKKHIINIDWYEDQPPKSQASHNFIHQYETLYKKYTEPSTTIIKRIPIKRKKFLGTLDTKQSIFHVILENNPST